MEFIFPSLKKWHQIYRRGGEKHPPSVLKGLKWGTVWTFISRGIRNTKSQTFGFPDLLNKTGLFWNFWLWCLVTLIPLEIKLHLVPHFQILSVMIIFWLFISGSKVVVCLLASKVPKSIRSTSVYLVYWTNNAFYKKNDSF